MQTDVPLNINDNRMQYGSGGSVIPSSRVPTYKFLNHYYWRKRFQLLPSMITVGSVWDIIAYCLHKHF